MRTMQGGASCPGWAPSFFCLRLWDAAHAPDHEVDDEAIWAEFGEAQARWPAWVLLGAALSAVTTATNRGSGSIPASRSIAQAALSGFTIGVYIALEFFQGQELLQVVSTAVSQKCRLGCRHHSCHCSPALYGCNTRSQHTSCTTSSACL